MRYHCNNCKMVWMDQECPDKKCPECGKICRALPAMKLRWNRQGEHFVIQMFAGPDIEHLANCGTLRMREKEFGLLERALFFATDSGEAEDKFDFAVQEVCYALDMS